MASGRRSILVAIAAALVAVPALAVVRAVPGAPTPAGWIVLSAHPDGATAAQLYRVQATGGSFEQITTGGKPATSPSFSPDGTRLVFTRLGSGIFVVNFDGTGLRRLTSHVRDSSPVWSPDGKRIAYTDATNANAFTVFVVDVATGETTYVADGTGADWLDNHTLIVEHI
jgi:TolB protein